jgi:predicted XRE-type DNA-binding protein
MNKSRITLTQSDRSELEKFSKTGKGSARLINRAKIILALDTSDGRKSAKQEEISRLLGISRQAVNDAKKAFKSCENVSAFLQRKKRETPPIEAKVTGELEARIIALACSEPPKGCSKWALRLLANKCVELQYAETMSHMTVSRVLKKHNLSLT